MCKTLWSILASAGFLVVDGLQQRAQAQTGAFRRVAIPGWFAEVPRGETTELSSELSLGTLLAYEPQVRANDQLFLFLAGSTMECGKYSQLLETVAEKMRVLCLPYDNRLAVGLLCGFDANCYGKTRMAAYNGSFAHIPGNNIESRLVSALRYLARKESPAWGQYVKPLGKPDWRQVRVAGHSQGAGDAAFIGYATEVARVIQFSGVCDHSDWTVKMRPPVTPASRFFGLASAYDPICPALSRQIHSWKAEGALHWLALPKILEQSDKVPKLGAGQVVLSKIKYPGCGGSSTVDDLIDEFTEAERFEQERATSTEHTCGVRAHESTSANWPWRSPYANGLWQALAGI